jgi:hypothetical protein
VRNTPHAIRTILPSMAAAHARCMGAATGASHTITASTVVLSLRGAGGAAGRKSSEGCASLDKLARRKGRVEVRVTGLGFGAGGSRIPSKGITLLDGRSWKSMAWRGAAGGVSRVTLGGAGSGSAMTGCGTAASAPVLAIAYISYCGRPQRRQRRSSSEFK